MTRPKRCRALWRYWTVSAKLERPQGTGQVGPDEKPRASGQLRILYVTMQFPVPSEAFAAVELRALRRAGATISVATFRPRPAGCAATLAERGLADLPLDHNSLRASLRGLLVGLIRPTLPLFLIGRILSHCRARPDHLWRSLVLVPRTLDLFARIVRERPEVLHLFWGHYPSLLGLLVERYAPATMVSMSLVAYDLEMGYGCSGPAARKAAVVWTLAEVNWPAIERLGVEPSRIGLCYRGIEVPRDRGRRPLKLSRRIVVVERLIAEKRTDLSLRVFQQVHRACPEASLEVLGNGPEQPALIRLARELGIADRVSFLGHLSHPEVFQHLAQAEIMLSMTQLPGERLPNAVKEAMLQRCVCVVAHSPGIEELLGDSSEGLIVAPGDIAAAAAGIVHLFADPERLARLGRRAHIKITERFDVDRLTAHRLAVWRQLLTQRGDWPGIDP